MILSSILFTALFSALSEIAAITFPARVISLASLVPEELEEGSISEKLGKFEQFFMYTSFAYFVLIPLLLFSNHVRFIGYGLFYLFLAILGKTPLNRFLLNKTTVILLSSIQLFLLVDIIRSCFISINMR